MDLTFTFMELTPDGHGIVDADTLQEVCEASEQTIMQLGGDQQLVEAWKSVRDAGLPAGQRIFIARFRDGKLLLGSTDEWTFRVMGCMASA